MVSEVRQAPANAKDFSATRSGIRKLGTLVPTSEVSPTGSLMRRTLRFVPHEAPPVPELRAGSGIGQAGPGIGEPAPVGAQSFAPVPVFEAPLGEQRI
ncbi:MAG: hypothetical protein KBD51_01215 [Candidatus Levybacteria bacterium]|nr:hypothetical protein [Candidatus Levybacteria bacterium]